MNKIKINVPKEFEVFLDKALDVLSHYEINTTIGLGNIWNDLAKFRYYIQGMEHEIKDHANVSGLSKDSKEYIEKKLIEIGKLSIQLDLIFKALTDENTKGD